MGAAELAENDEVLSNSRERTLLLLVGRSWRCGCRRDLA